MKYPTDKIKTGFLASYERLFASLHQKPIHFGFYIIEDWGAGFLKDQPKYKGIEAAVEEMVWKLGGTMVRNKDGGTYAVLGREIV